MGTTIYRYFCAVEPGCPWSVVAHQYAEALREAGLSVRLIAIGGSYLMEPSKLDGPEGRAHADGFAPWRRLAPLFGTPIGADDTVVNVVCAPAGMLLGPQKTLDDGQVVYEPKTALSGLHTPGMKNVAITGCVPGGPEFDHDEAGALKRYELVACPSCDDMHDLRAFGVNTAFWPPDELATLLRTPEAL